MAHRSWPILLALSVACLPVDDEPVVETDTESTETDPIPVETDPPVEEPLVCADPGLANALASLADWPIRASCSHIWFGLINEQRRYSMRFNLLTRERTFTVGQELAIDFAAPGSAVASLEVSKGTSLARICSVANDTGELPTVVRAWNAVTGVATVTVTEISEALDDGTQPFEATIAWTGIVLESADPRSQRCPVPDASFTEVTLGELP